MMTSLAVTGPMYPLPRPVDDLRFNLGFIVDVIKVLTDHGFPPIEGGPDYVRLQQALFGFIYETPAVDQ